MSSLVADRAAQLPSVDLSPKWSRSDGVDALFLADAYGLTADPWQDLVIKSWLGRRSDGKWAAPRCGLAVPRQNGKNAVIEMRELYGMVALGERFLHTAHEAKTAAKAFTRLRGFFENERQYPELAELVKEIRLANGQERIVLHNGGSVEVVARSKSSGRGFSVDVLVLDEAQELSDDALAALLPTISASPNPQTIMTGTPPSPSATGEVFTRMRTSGVEGTDRRLCWLEWSCANDADLDDELNWSRANPAIGHRVSLEHIMDERSTMDDDTFARERLGVWDDTSLAGVVDMARWAELRVAAERPSQVVFSVEVSPSREWSSIGMAGVLGDRRLVQIVESSKGTQWLPVRLAELAAKWSPLAVAVDPGGPAGSLLPALRERDVEPVLVTGREVAQGCGLFMDAVADGSLAHLDQQLLAVSLESAKKRSVGDSWVFHPATTQVDVSPLKAVVLALFVLERERAKPAPKRRSGLVVGMR
jgi:phage terminase large subunit-like protein